MHSVTSSLFYLKPSDIWLREKPYFITVPPSALPEGQKVTNEESIPINDVQIHDVRDDITSVDLDNCGFTVAKQDFSSFSADVFADYKSLRKGYTPIMQQWVKEILGAESVHILSVNARRRDTSFPDFTWGTSGDSQPIQGVHIDYTPKYSFERIERELGTAKFEEISGRRMQILNIWRPLFGPIRDWPLGVLDIRSVDADRDLIAADVVYPHFVGESFNVFYHDSHRWYYMSDQMPDEVLIFKSFDSAAGVASACPHASFDLGLPALADALRGRMFTEIPIKILNGENFVNTSLSVGYQAYEYAKDIRA